MVISVRLVMFQKCMNSKQHKEIEILFSLNIFQLKLKNIATEEEYDFEAGVFIETDRHNDFWRELPVKTADITLTGMYIYSRNELCATTPAIHKLFSLQQKEYLFFSSFLKCG